ncbi:hypothetical protein MRB53_033231 [Persea americana]|uniref:Uncharacterized protein n=1 Tax=Persea americana TaxID=3435 RepID=A0ACC2KTW0_PERAE|nr:hypothetical protein MRB53_033231 [Persea americana]
MTRALSVWQQLPRGLLLHHETLYSCCFASPHQSPIHHLLSSFLTHNHKPSLFSFRPSATVHSRSNGLRFLQPSDLRDEEEDATSDSESPAKKSRNERKREARRSVRWGMDLASFSPPWIKKILRVVSLGQEVYEAIMVVKRFGPDVKEGKRRQFNYIGKLLRKAPQPELMDAIIQASKDGDVAKLQVLSGEETWTIEQDEAEEEDTESDDDEVSHNYVDIATRWFDGLIDKDSSITKEVYSVHNVEFDRQELRKLVRRVQSMQERQLDDVDGNEVDAALMSAKKSLIRFLRALAKRTSATEWI